MRRLEDGGWELDNRLGNCGFVMFTMVPKDVRVRCCCDARERRVLGLCGTRRRSFVLHPRAWIAGGRYHRMPNVIDLKGPTENYLEVLLQCKEVFDHGVGDRWRRLLLSGLRALTVDGLSMGMRRMCSQRLCGTKFKVALQHQEVYCCGL